MDTETSWRRESDPQRSPCLLAGDTNRSCWKVAKINEESLKAKADSSKVLRLSFIRKKNTDLFVKALEGKPAKSPVCCVYLSADKYGNIYLLVPTRWFGAISIVSVIDSWRTARPRSAMAHVPFFLTRIFLDLRSRWAMPGLPAREQILHLHQEHAPLYCFFFFKHYPLCKYES